MRGHFTEALHVQDEETRNYRELHVSLCKLSCSSAEGIPGQ